MLQGVFKPLERILHNMPKTDTAISNGSNKALKKLDKKKIEVKNYVHDRDKSKYWAFIVYPESINKLWKDYLIQQGIRFAVSPLHDDSTNDHIYFDQDKNELVELNTGKVHKHVLIAYNNTTTGHYIYTIVSRCGGVYPVPVSDPYAYYQYLTHANRPEKKQYDAKDIETYNGFNVNDLLLDSPTERERTLTFLTDFIFNNNIYDYTDLIFTLKKEGWNHELRTVMNNVTYFREIFFNKMQRNKDDEVKKINDQTQPLFVRINKKM